MSSNETSRAPDLLDTEKRDEERMRNVLLGLGGGGGGRSGRGQRSTPQAHAPAGRHRFAQDGDVPVVRLSLARTETREVKRPLPEPVAVTVEPVDRVRAAQHAAERALHDVTTTLHGVQTRLGHAELDLEQALAQIQVRDQELRVLRAELRARDQELAAARRGGEASRRQVRAERPVAERLDTEPGAEIGAKPVAAQAAPGLAEAEALFAALAPVRDGGAEGGSPEPVKWWRD